MFEQYWCRLLLRRPSQARWYNGEVRSIVPYRCHGRLRYPNRAAKDVDKFVRMFFETFADLKGRRFHLAGESYAGRYLPLFGVEIADGNRKAVIGGHTPVNLVSVLIGNGLVDDITTIPTYYDQACTRIKGAPNTPVLDAKTCTTMQSMVSVHSHSSIGQSAFDPRMYRYHGVQTGSRGHVLITTTPFYVSRRMIGVTVNSCGHILQRNGIHTT